MCLRTSLSVNWDAYTTTKLFCNLSRSDQHCDHKGHAFLPSNVCFRVCVGLWEYTRTTEKGENVAFGKHLQSIPGNMKKRFKDVLHSAVSSPFNRTTRFNLRHYQNYTFFALNQYQNRSFYALHHCLGCSFLSLHLYENCSFCSLHHCQNCSVFFPSPLPELFILTLDRCNNDNSNYDNPNTRKL